jgi:hypothetical protein
VFAAPGLSNSRSRGCYFARSSALEEDERKHQEPDQEGDFDPGEPKFRFSVEADRHEIQTDDHDEYDGHPNCDVEFVVLVVDD